MVFPVSNENTSKTQKTETSQKKPGGAFKKLVSRQVPLQQPSRRSIFDIHREKERPKEKERLKEAHPHGHGDQKVENQHVSRDASVSSIHELSAEMTELLQKMADYVTLESKKGISTIELTVNLANSPFQGTGIRVDHYDTAPHSFNIELSHSQESVVNEFTLQLPTLLKALQTRLENFQIHLLPPSYAKEKPSLKPEKTREEKKVDKLKNSPHKRVESEWK